MLKFDFVMLESNVHVCDFCSMATGCCLNVCPHAVLLQMSCFPPANELQDIKHIATLKRVFIVPRRPSCPQAFLSFDFLCRVEVSVKVQIVWD